MRYESTREGRPFLSAAQAILAGLAPDGGLLTPESIPRLSEGDLEALIPLTYQERAEFILARYLTDFSREDLVRCIGSAYNGTTFSDPRVAPLHRLDRSLSVLELWHGPTCAFKDMALQILPHLLTTSAAMEKDLRTYVILVATSGDTGKAALEGFRDVDRTRILVFYPDAGVSQVQKLQMVTQEGSNVGVLAVRGNFDDTQSGVKEIFSDQQVEQLLAEAGMRFSSANSINWGRLAPQIVYYFSAYCDMVRQGDISCGDPVNFVVPTGNFGNILAGYFAREMGLPVNRLVCAANANNVLTDFIRTGFYDRNRPFSRTISPSMDILISSNLERLIYLLSGRDADRVAGWMGELAETGRYQVTGDVLEKVHSLFWSDFSDDEETVRRIRDTWNTYGYLTDTHTAVAMDICEKYRKETGDTTPTVVVSTASPFKFTASVAEAVLPDTDAGSELELLEELSRYSRLPIPAGLSRLDARPVLHRQVIGREDMSPEVLKFLGLNDH